MCDTARDYLITNMLEFLIRFLYTALVLIYVFTLYFLLETMNKMSVPITITLKTHSDNAVISQY